MTYPYVPPVRDMLFVIEDWLDAPSGWREIPQWSELDAQTVRQVVEEAARFVEEQIAPLDSTGDIEGCHFEDGAVTMPKGFVESYAAYVEGGWPAIAAPEALDGQALPGLLEVALHEMIAAANHAWLMSPGLSHGALACLQAHGSGQLKRDYLPDIVSGQSLVTMCLTEPQAGTDLGQLGTRAVREPGSDRYLLTGGKIFITGGEHNLSDNIVHLVLARLPDAPAGTRGLSLFLVPKWLPGEPAPERNAVYCDGIEKKMGLKASPTCTMRFEQARGFLVGEPHRGLAAMFVMMNAARLQVAMQGVGHAESACQRARAYAEERRQGRAVSPSDASPRIAAGPAAIVQHPAVRRTLLDLRCMVEGMRAIGYWTGMWIDRAAHHPDDAQRARADGIASLLTPIVKAFFTATGFNCASSALQVFGGYGYIHEYRIEQTVRDARVTMLYEGTNEAQAIDLVTRKIVADKGRNLDALLLMIAEECQVSAPMGETATRLAALTTCQCAAARDITDRLLARSASDSELVYRIADDYLAMLGWLLMAYAWLRSWRTAGARLDENDPFHEDKRVSALYFFDHRSADFHYWKSRVETGMARPLPFLAPARSVA